MLRARLLQVNGIRRIIDMSAETMSELRENVRLVAMHGNAGGFTIARLIRIRTVRERLRSGSGIRQRDSPGGFVVESELARPGFVACVSGC